MNADYIRNMITQLRLKKNVSEHRMSLELGHARSYIHGIVSGRTLPSMAEFLALCEYFEITPEQFFHEGTENPILMNQLINECQTLKDEDLVLLLTLIDKLKKGYTADKK